MIFPLSKWHFDINWHTFEKKWANVFQIYPNAIHLNPLQFCPSMPLLGFPVFYLSSSIVLNCYFHILVNSMTIWSVLKLPKIVWPSPFNSQGTNKNEFKASSKPSRVLSSYKAIKCERNFFPLLGFVLLMNSQRWILLPSGGSFPAVLSNFLEIVPCSFGSVLTGFKLV